MDLLLGKDRKEAPIQQLLLSNGSEKKHVSMVTKEHGNNGRNVFHAVIAEVF
jgi:hypothetical protein